MNNNDWKHRLGMVYSTNPDYEFVSDSEPEHGSLPRNAQKLRVSMERAGRGGKTVTLVKGFVGSSDELKELARILKNRCGVGGTAKNGEIVIQGDFRARVVEILKAEGYSNSR